MKLEIQNRKIGLGYAIGNDETGNEFIVIGGDLCYGETIEVALYQDSDKLVINSKVNYESIELFSEYFDKDGLIEISKLKEVSQKSNPYRRIYEINKHWVFLERRIKNEVEFLYQNNLIDQARVRITKDWATSVARAPVYSVNFIQLLRKLIEKGKPISSYYYCEREKDFDKGVYADLFILGNFNENDLQIQLWQIIDDGSEVFFAHGLIDRETFEFTHFDLATHIVAPEMIPQLLHHKRRMDLIEKIKWLRLDGRIPYEIIFELIKIFFPIDYLIDEFLEIPVPKKGIDYDSLSKI